jgi:hypothetical protein
MGHRELKGAKLPKGANLTILACHSIAGMVLEG